MKIVITSNGTNLDAQLDLRFGRAQYFLLIDMEDESVAAHDNTQNLNAAQGAGIQAGQKVARLGAKAVVTGNVGPKAFGVLQSAGIKIYLGAGGTAREILEQFKAGSLQEVEAASKPGHWM